MSLWGCEELYVTGLPADVTEQELRGLFGTHGAVKEAVIVNKKGPSMPNAPQSCIVRMCAHVDAVRAKKALHKYDWMGKQISVKWSHNQRVLWVSNLHETVTNEVLQSAFAQFGAVSKAVVACDAPNNTSKGWGFVAFENKRFAVKALEAVRQRPFIIGSGMKPVAADWARNEEVVEGFSEEVRTGHKGPPPGPLLLENAARFPPPHSKEDTQGARLLALRAEYEELRRILKERLDEAEKQVLIAGNAPRLSYMLLSHPYLSPPPYMQPPPPRPPMGPPPPGPHPPVGPPPPVGPQAPMGPPPPYGNYSSPMGHPYESSGTKREGETFHHVPPPSKRAMTGNQAERFNPNPGAPPKQEQHQHQHQQAGQQHQQRPSAAFVRGGELHTVNPGGDPSNPRLAHQEGSTAPPAAGAKPPGSHDHGGIGFSGPAGQAGGAGQAKAPVSMGTPNTQAPYTAYQFPYTQQQQTGQVPNTQAPAQGPGTYGTGGPPPPSYQQQQPQYGSYGPPPPTSAPSLSPQPAPYQSGAYQSGPAGTYQPPPDQQQYQYSSYNGYNYYQQGSTPQQQQQQQQPPTPGQAPQYSGGGPAATAPVGPPSQQMQQQQHAYGMPPQQQQQPMYATSQQHQGPQSGHGYYS